MKKVISVLMVFVAAIEVQSATISENSIGLYEGEEQVGEHPTGHTCYLYVDMVEVNAVGKHCYNLTTRMVFATDRDTHPKDEILVMGHITNFHRPEYPQIKTCAKSLDGKTSGNDIYGDDTNAIYSQLFSWEGNLNGYQFDFFVSFSPNSKLPSYTRLHRMNWLSEKDYDCVNLQKL